MRQEKGLDSLIQQHAGQLSAKVLAKLLLEDLEQCCCKIFGKTKNEEPVLLAELNIDLDSLFYEMFDQRIEFVVTGDILNDQYVPLIYLVKGNHYSFHGRCSVIRKVCGVDLYLSKSYTSTKGDHVRHKFFVSVKKLFKMVG